MQVSYQRDILRGMEERVFDLVGSIHGAVNSKLWAEWLRFPLEQAATAGDIDLTTKLLSAGAKGSAVHLAIRGGHAELVDDLLENGASPNAKDQAGDAPLHLAAGLGQFKIVSLLLHNGADKNAANKKGIAPIHLAAEHGHLAAAKILLDAGADVSVRCGDYMFKHSLGLAARNGHANVLRCLIRHGADVQNAADCEQSTPLHEAAGRNGAGMIDALVEAGASVGATDIFEWTPLHYASQSLCREDTVSLLRHKAAVNARDIELESPLHVAARNGGKKGAAEMVDLLLRWGADETAKNARRQTAAEVAMLDIHDYTCREGEIDRVQRLLANAPASRAWRRRGFLVLCRSLPDRALRLAPESSNQAFAGMAWSDPTVKGDHQGSPNEPTGAGYGDGGGSECGGGSSGSSGSGGKGMGGDVDCGVVVARVLELREEGIFRNIVMFV